MKILPKHWRDYLLKKLFTWIWKFDLQYRNSTYCESLNQISNIKLVASFLESYHKVKLQGLKWELGVTAQFWIKYILLYQFQFAINTISLSNWWLGKNFYRCVIQQSPLCLLRHILQNATVTEASPRLIRWN